MKFRCSSVMLSCCQTDTTAMVKTIKNLKINPDLMPLGQIKKENLEKARDILIEIRYSLHVTLYTIA